jgi:hypothetical protein
MIFAKTFTLTIFPGIFLYDNSSPDHLDYQEVQKRRNRYIHSSDTYYFCARNTSYHMEMFMDSNKMFIIGLTILGLFVIIDSIWVVLMPPHGDEPQGYALTAIGIFLIFVVFLLARQNRKATQ